MSAVDDDQLLRSVALQNASTILAARQRAEQELVSAKERAEKLARELQTAMQRAQLGADIGRILTSNEPMLVQLRACADAIVGRLDAAFARIWTVSTDGTTLELQASAGPYAHLDGLHARVPIGQFEVGRIAERRAPHLTNDVQNDPLISVDGWAQREGLVGFAGYPLLVQDQLVGVVVIFSRHSLSIETLDALASVADIVALSIQRSRAEAARKLDADRREFLAEASRALATVLDVPKSLSNLAQLAVPKLAEWCAVQIVGDDRTFAESGIPRPGVPGRISALADQLMARGADHGMLASPSIMIVPLRARGRILGTMSFVSSESRRYTVDDLGFAEEFGRRAAIAIDNARLYESEQNARRNADLANSAKDDFLATVSHELRTPLNAMLGWTRMLRTGNLTPEKHDRALETIERNAITQAQLIEDLLDVSRIISGKLRLDVQSVELAHIVRHAIDALRLASEARSVVLVTSLDDRAGPIMGDPHRLQQVVWNLLSNAIKFTPKGGRIVLSVERVDSSLKLTVSDTGRGIPAEFIPQVFERFKQADGVTTRAHGGLGLGLAISRHIVELHGGTIDVESKGEGQGSVFTVVLPMSPIREARGAASPPGMGEFFGLRPELRGLRILVVDDEADARDLLVAVLEKCGSIVAAAASAREALEKVQSSEKPDVLISDIGMPGEDGYSLIRKIRALKDDRANIPAAALTAYARAEDRRAALDAGYMMHIAKPVEPTELVAVIANLTRFSTRR